MSEKERGLVTIRPQKWEAVASPGHEHFAWVDLLRLELPSIKLKIALAFLAIPLAYWISSKFGLYVGLGVGQVVGFWTWLQVKHIASAAIAVSVAALVVAHFKTRGLERVYRYAVLGLCGALTC